ncbi:MAG: site-specific integrase [Spirochaetota bacterium]
MTKRYRSKAERFTFTLFKRPNKDGTTVLYARLIEKSTGTVLAQRSTGTDDPFQAAARAGQYLVELPLPRIAQAKTAKDRERLDAAERVRNMDLVTFFTWFWTPGASDYIQDRIDAEKPLSNYYIQTESRYIAKHAATYQPFRKTSLCDVSLYLVEQWMHHLKRSGITPNVINEAMTAIRTPLSWAQKRNFLDVPFTMSAIVRPKKHHQKRGILSRTEVFKIVSLPTLDTMKPRPRLRDGKHHEDTAPIDLRMKALVLLSELAAMRRGEIRALRWQYIDFEKRRISIQEKFIDSDGLKAPKRESYGEVPMAKELETVLIELKKVASRVGLDTPTDFVIFNAKRGVPVAEVTMRRGYHRALALIGIEDDSNASKEGRPPKPGSQQARRLVLHSGRHGAATRLAEVIGPREAARITRHRSAQAFMGYADHQTDEMFDKAREALSVVK